MSSKVVITDHVYEDLSIERDILTGAGTTVVELDSTDSDALVEAATDASAVITTRAPITRAVLEQLPELAVVVRYGAGYENVDVEAATDHGVAVVTVPDFCIEEVATHALGLILACDRRIVQYDRHVRDGGWDWAHRAEHTRLQEQTLGIVGFGHVGRQLATMVQSLGVDCIGHSNSATQEELANLGVEKVPFETLLERSDIVSIHTALTDEKKHLFDESAFEQMKDTAILCNTSRGGLVDQEALVRALDTDEIALAGLDVLESEPPADDDPLLSHDDVVITPHVAWYSDTATETLRERVATEAIRVLEGSEPKNVINPIVFE